MIHQENRETFELVRVLRIFANPHESFNNERGVIVNMDKAAAVQFRLVTSRPVLEIETTWEGCLQPASLHSWKMIIDVHGDEITLDLDYG